MDLEFKIAQQERELRQKEGDQQSKEKSLGNLGSNGQINLNKIDSSVQLQSF